MIRIAAIVEGPTEQAFVASVLKEHLSKYGLDIWGQLAGKRGGSQRWPAVRKDILNTLKSGAVCTTMYDYYALPRDWPGRREAEKLPLIQRGPHVQACLLQDIQAIAGPDLPPNRFLPYVQMHEFEALLFSDARILAGHLDTLNNTGRTCLGEIQAVLQEHDNNPEAINDRRDTCPSRRIESLSALYRKKLHGSLLASKIGMMAIRRQCPHLNDWVARLESLNSN